MLTVYESKLGLLAPSRLSKKGKGEGDNHKGEQSSQPDLKKRRSNSRHKNYKMRKSGGRTHWRLKGCCEGLPLRKGRRFGEHEAGVFYVIRICVVDKPGWIEKRVLGQCEELHF